MQSNAAIGRAHEALVLSESRRESSVRHEESQGHGPFLVLTAGAALLLAFLLFSAA